MIYYRRTAEVDKLMQCSKLNAGSPVGHRRIDHVAETLPFGTVFPDLTVERDGG